MSNTGIYNANTHNTDQNIYSRKTLNSIIPINPASAAYQMIKLTAAAKVPSAIAQTMQIYHSDAYAKELKLETVLTKMSKFTI